MGDNELLEKIDQIRDRLGVSYKEAREALEKAGGDLVEALINLESQFEAVDPELLKERWTRRLQGKSEEVLDRLKNLLEKGTATKVRLKQGNKTILEIPASIGMLGVIGMLMSTELLVLGAVGTVTALFKRCTLEVEGFGEPPDDDEVDIPPA
jgi:DNA-binding transcriptional MerR regulator